MITSLPPHTSGSGDPEPGRGHQINESLPPHTSGFGDPKPSRGHQINESLPPHTTNSGNPKPSVAAVPVLEAVGLTMTFSGIRALGDVSIKVGRGERVGLIGPNGAGKTTLLNCLLGVLRPESGRVFLNGIDLKGWSVYRRARAGIARTFQRVELFSDVTVAEHLLIAERIRNRTGSFRKDMFGLGRPSAVEIAACTEILELLGIADLAAKPVESLSLGQSRLVEVGRALATQPQVLLLDEPSSGLDPDETSALANTLKSIQEERQYAVLMVEHDLRLVADFTERIYVLDFGTTIAEGPTLSTLTSRNVRRAYLGSYEIK